MSCLMSQSCVRGCCYTCCAAVTRNTNTTGRLDPRRPVLAFSGLVNPGQCAISLGEISLCWPFYSQMKYMKQNSTRLNQPAGPGFTLLGGEPVFYKKMPKHCVVVGGGAAGLSRGDVVSEQRVSLCLGRRTRRRTLPHSADPERRGRVSRSELLPWAKGNPAFELCDSLGLLPAERQHSAYGAGASCSGAMESRLIKMRFAMSRPSCTGPSRSARTAGQRRRTSGACACCLGGGAAWAASVYDSDAPLLDAAWQAAESMQCAIAAVAPFESRAPLLRQL